MAAVTVLQSKNTDDVQLLPPDKSNSVMESLVENPASPNSSRETTPRTPDDDQGTPRGQGSLSSLRSTEGSPREQGDRSRSPTPPERRKYKAPTPPGRRKYSKTKSPPDSPKSPTIVSPRSKEDSNLSPRTIGGITNRSEDADVSLNLSPTKESRLKKTGSSGSESSRKSDSEEKKSKGPFG